MSKLKKGDKVALVANSNGMSLNSEETINNLIKVLNELGLEVCVSNCIYSKYSVFNGSGKERAEELMKFFKDKSIKAIFDISGGDLSNQVLDYLDFDVIKENKKMFFGYSDLTVMLNALYSQSDLNTYLYQVRNLVYDNGTEQIKNFKETFMDDKTSIYDFKYKWIQGNHLEGIVVGGNIRCFLKLAGTKYMPDFNGKILFIESYGGNVAKMTTFLTQYKQLGVFNKIKGIILGTYTEMESEGYSPCIEELVCNIVGNKKLSIVKTDCIGHGTDSKCIKIGANIIL